MVVLKVKIVPETWFLAPKVTEAQLKRWYEKGWIDEEMLHADRAFFRNSEGKPILLKLHIRAFLRRAAKELGKEMPKFEIVDENGRPVEYVVINDQPLRYRRPILDEENTTTEFFEYLDGTYEIEFLVETDDPKTLAELFAYAGKYIGYGGTTGKGYGRFKVFIEAVSEK